jgi:uncharacterized phiE125 gp8 family phage protein
MALRVITPPLAPGLITLDQAKAQLRVIDDLDDTEIGDLIRAASDLVEDYVERRYLAQTLEWTLERWHDAMVLPIAGPLGWDQLTINSITYGALDGTTQTLDPLIYWIRPAGPTVKIVKRWFVIWPWLGDAAERVIINFSVAGTIATVPSRVQHATKLLLSHMFQNRDAVVGVDGRDSSTELPLGVVNLLYSEMWDQVSTP